MNLPTWHAAWCALRPSIIEDAKKVIPDPAKEQIVVSTGGAIREAVEVVIERVLKKGGLKVVAQIANRSPFWIVIENKQKVACIAIGLGAIGNA